MKSKKRLIVAQDACKYAKGQLIKGKFNFEEYDAVIETINNTDTIDAVEVVHGRWIDVRQYCGDFMCSNCNGISCTNKYNYCPDCGAKMDEIGDKQNGKSKFE